MEPAGRVMSESTPEEIERVLERGWETGGFRYIFETFDDMLVSEESNEIASEFIRNKIRAIVHDRRRRAALSRQPRDRRQAPAAGPLLLRAFNRDNVDLVDVRDSPIDRVTPTGIRLADGAEHEFDVIVFATGFDAGTGALLQVDVRGRGGRTLHEVWADGPQTHLGVAVTAFRTC